MSFPLIQQPAPLQQLADTITGIRQRRDARRQQQFENQQANEQMAMRKAAFEQSQAEARDLNTYRTGQTELARATLAATIQRDAVNASEEQQRRQAAVAQQIITTYRELGFTVDPLRAAAEARYAIRGTRNIPEDVAFSTAYRQQRGFHPVPNLSAGPSIPEIVASMQQNPITRGVGLQGSAVRAPAQFTQDGITFQQPTRNYNAPSGGGGGSQLQQDADAALGTLISATQRLNTAENADRTATVHPWSGLPGRLAAGAGRKLFGDQNEMSQALSLSGLTPAQQDVGAIEDEWTHAYLVHLPKYRGSVPMYDNVKHAYFPRTGVSDPAVMASFRARREGVVRRIAQSRARGMNYEQIQSMLEGDVLRFLGGPRALPAPTTGTPTPGPFGKSVV